MSEAKRYIVELYRGAPEVHEVVLASDYATLSAVTAERDQSISLTADYIAMLGEAGLQIDQLTAERDRLLVDLERAHRATNSECMDWAREFERRNAVQAERDQLRAEVEALRKAPAGWAKMNPAFVVEHIRETTVFDADMIEAMLEFAIGAAMAAKEA
ncbi:hypothetical protein ACYCFC_05490 [Stutzerimonas sp. NM35]